MKLFTELTYFAGSASARRLAIRVRELESAGSSGISVWDHIFSDARDVVICDPLTTLAAVAAISETLEVQTIVVNSVWQHPGLLMRQFAQLAVLAGGDRVTAGLGAGWSVEEFEAMGMRFPSNRERVDRLEEVLSIASQLYGPLGRANLSGGHFEAADLPLNPMPATRPRILVGAAGDRVVSLAARYADKVDLIGLPRTRSTGPALTRLPDQHDELQGGRGRTRTADLVERVELLRNETERAGRPRDAVEVGVQVNFAVLCRSSSEVEAVDRRICEEWFHIPEQSLADNPYTLRGEPQQIADAIAQREELLDLTQITIQEHQDSVEFCDAVVPLLQRRARARGVPGDGGSAP